MLLSTVSHIASFFFLQVLTHREIVVNEKPHISFHISDYHVQYMNNRFFFNFTIALVSFKLHPIDGSPIASASQDLFEPWFCHQEYEVIPLALNHFQWPAGSWM